MLTLTRREGESLVIELADYVDPATPVGDVFANEDITIRLGWARKDQARIGVHAPSALHVVRTELLEQDEEAA